MHSLAGRGLIVIDTPLTTLAQTEHCLRELGPSVPLADDVFLCTHEVRDARPHYAFSLVFSGPWNEARPEQLAQQLGPEFTVTTSSLTAGEPARARSAAGVRLAAAEIRSGQGGRAVRFPGWAQLAGRVSVHDLLQTSAIDRVSQLGGGEPDADSVIETRDFVRPRWVAGQLVLKVLPAAGNTLAPFEVPNPTPCCADHG